MKRMKPNRKSTIPKIKREYKPKINKNLKQRVRHYKQLLDANRKLVTKIRKDN
jgi:hypothetical protein